MSRRVWAGLLLMSALLPAAALSQPPRPGMPQGGPGGVLILPADAGEERPSHKRVEGSFDESLTRPEDAVRDRLRKVRDRKKGDDQVSDLFADKEIQSLARRLMQDKQFLESIKGQFSEDDAKRLLGDVSKGKGIGSDPNLAKLLREAQENKALSKDQEGVVKDWRDRLQKQGVVEPTDGGKQEQAKWPSPKSAEASPDAAPALPREPEPETNWKLDPKTEDWLKRNADRWVTDLDKWSKSKSGRRWGDLAKDFGKRLEANKSVLPGVAERVGGMGKYLPKMSNYLPRPRISSLPNLPRFALPSRLGVPSPGGGASFANGGKVLLWLLVLGVVAYLIYRAGSWVEKKRQERAAEWRLGPWPVRPDGVRTRGDLIRAFEYLALLCLGRKARTHNHVDLAQQIGAQTSLDADRRRDAAASLAEAYEHARYRPDDEPLPEDELRRARRELCYLAGVAAA